MGPSWNHRGTTFGPLLDHFGTTLVLESLSWSVYGRASPSWLLRKAPPRAVGEGEILNLIHFQLVTYVFPAHVVLCAMRNSIDNLEIMVSLCLVSGRQSTFCCATENVWKFRDQWCRPSPCDHTLWWGMQACFPLVISTLLHSMASSWALVSRRYTNASPVCWRFSCYIPRRTCP